MTDFAALHFSAAAAPRRAVPQCPHPKGVCGNGKVTAALPHLFAALTRTAATRRANCA
jgi:hypothetical protein